MSKIESNLLYTKEHEWLKVDGNLAQIGITDFAQSSLGDIVFVEAPEQGEQVTKESSFGVVESIKSVSDLYSPVDGKVTERNQALEDTPEKLNEDPFNSWIIKVELNDLSQLDDLMDAAAYEQYCSASS